MLAKIKAKNEARLALIVAESPTDGALVSKFGAAEPTRTNRTIA